MQNIYEFSPNTVGILGDLSFSNFKTLRIANLLKERNLFLNEISDFFILETRKPWSEITESEKRIILRLLGGKNNQLITSQSVFISPKKGIQSPWSSKVKDIFLKCGMDLLNIEKLNLYSFSKETDLDLKDLSILFDPLTEEIILELAKIQELFSVPDKKISREIECATKDSFIKANKDLNLGLNEYEINYLFHGLKNIERKVQDSELMMFSQINSEHCRHKIFNSNWNGLDKVDEGKSLFSMIKDTYRNHSENVLSAYSDNAAVIEGFGESRFFPDPNSKKYKNFKEGNNFCIKVETHNHPTAIAPFPGAATGSGGEIRDEGATGRGAKPKAGLCGFSVSYLRIPNQIESWEGKENKPKRIASPLEIMIEGPIGAASFNNEFGRPNILGYFRSFEKYDEKNKTHSGFHKPIMIAGGIGNIRPNHTHKNKVKKTAKIVVIGGPGYLIGLGGGSASSTETGSSKEALDFASVQRSNPEMQRRCQEVIDQCWQLGDANPISFIHDVGAGGLSNALPELINDCGFGAAIDFSKIPCADPSMSEMEIWCNESQERYVMAIEKDNLKTLENICLRENCPIAVVGDFLEEKRLIVSRGDQSIINLDMDFIFGANKNLFRDYKRPLKTAEEKIKNLNFDIKKELLSVLRHPTVSRKNFLINIGDRNVGGLTFRDQMIGPLQIPVADNAITMTNYNEVTGEAMAMGERSPVALINPQAAGRLAIVEALLNLLSSGVQKLSSIKLSANWMAAPNTTKTNSSLFNTVKTVSEDICQKWNLTIPVGKDSLSMETNWGKNKNTSPESLIVSAFSPIKDITKSVTPMLSNSEDLVLVRINFGSSEMRLGGSILSQVINSDFKSSPDIEEMDKFPKVFDKICELINKKKISALHDISDGGMVTSLIEMMFAGNCGLKINLDYILDDLKKNLFSEEPGLILQLSNESYEELLDFLKDISFTKISKVGETISEDRLILEALDYNEQFSFKELMANWSKVSISIKKLRDNPLDAEQEEKSYLDKETNILKQHINFLIPKRIDNFSKPSLAVIREQGVNGHTEMAAAFSTAGFEVTDIHMNDLLSQKFNLKDFQGIIFPGGFSFGDVLGAGKGWANFILNNSLLKNQFEEFFNKKESFSLGVCNGCQVLSNLKEIIPGTDNWPKLKNNSSGQFEARLAQIKIFKSNSLLFDDMEDSQLLVPVAHGEGKMIFSNPEKVSKNNQLVMSYVDTAGNQTESYPGNPNGSDKGITGICSEDGKVTIMMPHPERAFLNAQLSWTDLGDKGFSPWIKMFHNARKYF